MKMSKEMKLWFVIVASCTLIISVAASAGAENNNRKLYGDYATNFSLNCATCNTNFEFLLGVAPYCPSSALSTTYTWNAQGVYNFDGNGNFTFVGRYLGVLSNPFPLTTSVKTNVVLPAKLKCVDGGHYTVNDDLSVEAGFDFCTVYADESEHYPIHKISNINFRGQLLDRMDSPILLITDTMDSVSPPPRANVEKVTTGTIVDERIGGMTGTAISIKGQRMRKKID